MTMAIEGCGKGDYTNKGEMRRTGREIWGMEKRWRTGLIRVRIEQKHEQMNCNSLTFMTTRPRMSGCPNAVIASAREQSPYPRVE